MEEIPSGRAVLADAVGPRVSRLAPGCTAMATTYLGPTFDIRSVGTDLVFPSRRTRRARDVRPRPTSVTDPLFLDAATSRADELGESRMELP